jgi:hypothetical protein
MSLQKEASLAYIFDPLQNTFIDDEDTSLGNKLQIANLVDDLQPGPLKDELLEKFDPSQESYEDYLRRQSIPYSERPFNAADGGMIGGGTISGEDYGDRTGFAVPKFNVGGSKTPPFAKGKWGVRTNLTVPEDTPGYLGKSGEQAIFATEADAQRFIDEDLNELFLESQANKKRSPVIEARLEKIKNIYKNLKASGQKKIYLNDIIDQLEGEKTVYGTGKRGIQKEQTPIKARTSFKANIKEALGEKIFDSLIKSPGEDPRITDANRGDLPIISLSRAERGETQRISEYLTDANKIRYQKILPKLRAINSRISQPSTFVGKKGINELKKITVKNFDTIIKKFPSTLERKTSVLKFNAPYDAKSYILHLIGRHVQEGGNLYRHVSGEKMKDVKFRNLKTNKLITIKNINLNSPEFKEAADTYNDFQKLKNIKIDNPITGEEISINNAIKQGTTKKGAKGPSDYLIIDHMDGILKNPLKNLAITTQKQNQGFELTDLSEDEKKRFYRKKLSLKDNIKRFSNYAKRILIDGREYKTPTETIEELRSDKIQSGASNIKSKMDASRMLTSKIPGGSIALTPLDFTLSMMSGMPLTESLASAGSYLLKDPYIGRAVNVPLAIAQDMQDPEETLRRGIERGEKAEAFLQELVNRVKEGAGDQPDIDPFQAAEGGRAGFKNGGAAGADDDFAAQLEYFFLNPDAELPAAKTFRETMNPVSILNDMIDPRNIPYYADRVVQSGIRIGEFGARVLPALGQLAADLIQRPAFKIKPSTNQGYVQDYTDQPLPLSESRIEGTGIFTDFLNNLVGSEGTDMITEKSGLGKLIEEEEQKMKDERKTAGAKILADQFTLGMELTAPIFPGYKLLQAYAKSRKLPVDKTTRETMDKEIDELLTKQGTNRRNFLKATGAGGAVMIAKMLGVGDEFATVTKVAEKAVPKGPVVPQYFYALVDKIKKFGEDKSKQFATMDREAVYVYKDYELYEDLSTGDMRVVRKIGDDMGYKEEEMVFTKGIGDESTKGTPPDEYDEFTVRSDPDGKMKDVTSNELEEIDDLINEVGIENVTIKELEAMGYDLDFLDNSIREKLGLKPVSYAKAMLKRQGAIKNIDDPIGDLPDLP